MIYNQENESGESLRMVEERGKTPGGVDEAEAAHDCDTNFASVENDQR